MNFGGMLNGTNASIIVSSLKANVSRVVDIGGAIGRDTVMVPYLNFNSTMLKNVGSFVLKSVRDRYVSVTQNTMPTFSEWGNAVREEFAQRSLLSNAILPRAALSVGVSLAAAAISSVYNEAKLQVGYYLHKPNKYLKTKTKGSIDFKALQENGTLDEARRTTAKKYDQLDFYAKNLQALAQRKTGGIIKKGVVITLLSCGLAALGLVSTVTASNLVLFGLVGLLVEKCVSMVTKSIYNRRYNACQTDLNLLGKDCQLHKFQLEVNRLKALLDQKRREEVDLREEVRAAQEEKNMVENNYVQQLADKLVVRVTADLQQQRRGPGNVLPQDEEENDGFHEALVQQPLEEQQEVVPPVVQEHDDPAIEEDPRDQEAAA